MFTIGTLAVFAWMIIGFIVVIDIFKQKTALGCLGLLLLPIIPLFWVVKGYGGNKKLMAPLLYGSAVLAITGIGSTWISASSSLEPFILASKNEGLNLSLTQIKSSSGEMNYVLLHKGLYQPKAEFTSVEQMIELIQKEKINELAAHYPQELSDEVIILAIPTKSGFIATYEIDGVNSIRKSYTSSPDNL